jgi:hypothetical protein
MRFRHLLIGLAAALVFIGGVPAHGGDIYVVTRPDLNLTPGDIREIYLGDKEFSGSQRIIPIDNQAAQAEFAAKVLTMNINRYNSLWTKKAFRDALNPPAVKATDIEVLEYVKRTHGAVGYMSSAPLDKGVVIVGKF